LNAGRDAFDETTTPQRKVHIRVVQRSGRKRITTIEHLDDDLDIAKICKALRKILACNGSVTTTGDGESVIHLQGDKREAVKKFLLDMEIYDAKDDRIMVHGGTGGA